MVCKYCSSMTAAMENANYCSHHQSNAVKIDSNAYFFSHSNVHSDKHQSRFSIRALSKGYQYYEIRNRIHILHNENFLVINDGEDFENYIDTHGNAEGAVIALNAVFLKKYLYELEHTSEHLLDNPGEKTLATLHFYENTLASNPKLQAILSEITSSIQYNIKTPLHYQQQFMKLLDELVGIENCLTHQIELIEATKKSTREELYRRLTDAKDFIDVHLHEKISVQNIAKSSCLSPFHFLRTFAAFFHISPYQYLLSQRLKKSHYLILEGYLSYSEVMNATGFENKRSFQRAFQKVYGITPYELHKKRLNNR